MKSLNHKYFFSLFYLMFLNYKAIVANYTLFVKTSGERNNSQENLNKSLKNQREQSIQIKKQTSKVINKQKKNQENLLTNYLFSNTYTIKEVLSPKNQLKSGIDINISRQNDSQ
ncbi:hypothetical protein ABPG72_005059 [Tetrahymena utriculariae]